jgi:hypothetical protein
LLTVTVVWLLVAPTPVAAKLIAGGITWIAAGTAPVPVSVTVAAFTTETELTVNVPVTGPVAVGAKTIPTVQVDPAARLPAQVFAVRLNWEVAASVNALTVNALVLLTVTVCAALDWPSLTAGKVNCAGLTPSPVKTWAVPLSGTLADVTPKDEDEIVSVAALPPVVAGSKITCSVQLLPLFRVAGQVLVAMEKLLAAWPPITKATLSIGAPPVLLTVSGNGELATPGCCTAKLRLAGLTLSAGGSTPAPLRDTCWAPSAS